MKKPVRFLTLLALLFFLSACAGSRYDNFSTAPAAAPAAPAAASAAPAATGSASWDAPAATEMFFAQDEQSLFIQGAEQLTPRRIKTGSMSVEASDVEKAMAEFESITLAYGGWVQSRNMTSGVRIHASLTLRIPAELYEDFVSAAIDIAALRSFNDSVEDVSAEYFDALNSLNINRAEQARLLDFIAGAGSIEDIILLEARLADVRLEIERHENNMRRIDRAVSYSTLHVNIFEQGQATIRPLGANLGTRMGSGFTSSISIMLDMIILLTYMSVPLAICGCCAFVGIKVYRRRVIVNKH